MFVPLVIRLIVPSLYDRGTSSITLAAGDRAMIFESKVQRKILLPICRPQAEFQLLVVMTELGDSRVLPTVLSTPSSLRLMPTNSNPSLLVSVTVFCHYQHSAEQSHYKSVEEFMVNTQEKRRNTYMGG
jgi:hypothetical protein